MDYSQVLIEGNWTRWSRTAVAMQTPVCTENLIRVDDVMESPKLAE
jgi:hypothetical protein